MAASFRELDPYKLTGVRVTDRKLGHGSYATVLELEYMGLKCAGKKIHELLLEQGDASYTVRRFEEECRLLSQVRHPNIVQFLGVYFQQRVRTPILVMEFLPTNLTSCIERYGILPKEISYSILHDVALGLCYLHNQTPPIIHRDLSSNNVLLTPNMTAKIADLGVARIFNNLTPLQVSRMTQTPGTPAFMPPEVMVADPKYNTSVDMFSYGIMMIHIFSGQWPEPQVGPSRTEQGRLIPVTEAERRKAFLQEIGNGHQYMSVIKKCIDNDPQHRACATKILGDITSLKPAISLSADPLEMLILKAEIEEMKDEIERQEKKHSIEKEALQMQIGNGDANLQLQKAEKDTKEAELKESLQKNKELYTQLLTQQEQFHKYLEEEKASHTIEIGDLMSKVSTLNEEKKRYLEEIASLTDSIEKSQADDIKKDTEIRSQQTILESQSKALEAKGAIISHMSKEVTKAAKYLINKKQVLLTSFTWRSACAELPDGVKVNGKKSIIIEDRVYCEGEGVSGECTVYCYDPSREEWTPLPTSLPLPVKNFALGEVSGKLVAVGGEKNNKISAEVYAYVDEKWESTEIPPMPTARSSPGVLSLQSALVVAGGFDPGRVYYGYFCAVEIFKSDTSQWYRTDPLPKACHNISLVAIGNTCYGLGGYSRSNLNQALYASVDDLLGKANQTTHSSSSDTQSVWRTLPNTPTYQPAAAVLAGNLLAIGGEKAEIHLYTSQTESWTYIGCLPCSSQEFVSVVSLLSLDILVIANKGKSVYKGTPSIFKSN